MALNLHSRKMLQSSNPKPWRFRPLLRYLAAIFFISFAVTNYFLWTHAKGWDPVDNLRSPLTFGSKVHPIKRLMVDARARHDALLAKQSHDIYGAAARYRARRGRHPPPGFDQWVKAAAEGNSVIVEDYFDRIYKDLAPFWAVDHDTITQRANSWHHVVKVRNGTARGAGDVEGRVKWLQLWTELVQSFAGHLPDVDMPINYMDEPRLLVPFEDIAKLVEEEQKKRQLVPVAEVTTDYKRLTAIDAQKLQPYDPEWFNNDNAYWDLARVTCPPKSPARYVEQASNLSSPVKYPINWRPDYSFKGYVKNWTAAMDPCLQPHLRQLHGTFVKPITLSTTKELIPLFGGSKLPMNNEILIPGAMYLSESEFYSGGEQHGPDWPKKKDGIVWRGDATGGRASPETWHHFQRHRLIQMLNGTTVSEMENNDTVAPTFALPSTKLYKSTRRTAKQLGDWLRSFANVGFVHLLCWEECAHMDPYYHAVDSMPMKDQYAYKFLPDADGNSFSARFRGFLRSTSTPLKATVYAEWHDDRLMPWVHFIPLDNTFQDLYSVLEYFSDDGGVGDAAARYIAEQGKEWAERVLRREDMRLYTWRLLLEWARVCDENRDTLGFVQDLVDMRK
ncbi:Fc.00g102220.m01.CDS01 [Cosmosporella sp. VM-42]